MAFPTNSTVTGGFSQNSTVNKTQPQPAQPIPNQQNSDSKNVKNQQSQQNPAGPNQTGQDNANLISNNEEYSFNYNNSKPEEENIVNLNNDMNNIFTEPSPNPSVPVNKPEVITRNWESMNLIQTLEKNFTQYESEIPPIPEDVRKKSIFLVNSIDEQKFSEVIKDLQTRVENPSVSAWLGLYIVWMRVPREPRYHDLYKNLILKLNKKDMIKRVMADSFK